MDHEHKVALAYVIFYAVPVLAICALFSWRVATRPNKSFRAIVPFIGLGTAAFIGIALAVASHYFYSV